MSRKPLNMGIYKVPEDRQHLVDDNYRLVRTVIRDTFSVYHEWYDDMYQEGCIGLIKAASRYKEDGGAQFSTYAYFSIKNAIQKFVSEDLGTIRVPVGVALAINSIRVAEQKNEADAKRKEILAHNQISENMLSSGKVAQLVVSMHETSELGIPYEEMLYSPHTDLFEAIPHLNSFYSEIYEWLAEKYKDILTEVKVYISYLMLKNETDLKVATINAYIVDKYKVTRSDIKRIVNDGKELLKDYYTHKRMLLV